MTRWFTLAIILLLTLSHNLSAEWLGPQTILEVPIGKEVGSIGVSYEDSFDVIPNQFVIDDNYNLIIGDEVNQRIQVFDSDGKLLSTFKTPPALGQVIYWPPNLLLLKNNLVIAAKGKCQFFSIDGHLNKEITIPNNYALIGKIDDNTLVFKSGKKYVCYSIDDDTSQIINTNPLTGRLKVNRQTSSKFISKIIHDGNQYEVISHVPVREYYFDLHGNLYWLERFIDQNEYGRIPAVKIHRQQVSDKKEDILLLPISTYDPRDSKDISSQNGTIRLEYGPPKIFDNGEIYCWARNKSSYRILRWTWHEDTQSTKTSYSNKVMVKTP